jgi:hypothetical protein
MNSLKLNSNTKVDLVASKYFCFPQIVCCYSCDNHYTTEPDNFFLRFIAYVFQLSILHVDVMQLISANMILFFSLVITKRPSA